MGTPVPEKGTLMKIVGVLPIALVGALAACQQGAISNQGNGGSGLAGGAGGEIGPAVGGVSGSSSIPLLVPDAGRSDVADPATPTESANCGLIPFDVTRRPADVLLVLDRSASMIEHEVTGLNGQMVTRAQAAKDAVGSIVRETEADILWGLKMFPEGNSAYCVVTPDKVDVTLDLNNYANISKVVNADAFDGDGTPTAAAVSAGANYLKNTVKDGNSKYLILATDGEPSDNDKNQCTGTWASPDVKTAAVNAVAAAAADGIKTYVIGVNTSSSSSSRTTLNRLAQAGKTADPPIAAGEDITSSKNLTEHFYAADDSQGMVTALGKITGQISDCRFPLGKAPGVPDNVVVKVTDASGNLVRVPVDATHSDGWDYTGTDHLTIEIYGSWCGKVKATTANNKVSIIFGCLGQIIP
jgi:hypothetical protein